MFFSAVHPLYLLADEIHSPRAVHPLHSMNSHIVWLYAAFGGSSTSLHAIVACMGMTAADLLQRLRACETVLADCDVGTHGLLSKGQSDIVLAMMSQTTISSDDVGPVTEQVLKCRWADPSQKAALLKMVGSLTRSARPRAKLQDFETLAMFIAEQMWAVLLNDEVDYHSKAALLCDHAVALQLRHPTEPTVGCMIALLLLVARALASLPLPDRIETIARLAHSWPKLLMKVMTKLAADTAKRNKAARPRATKAATVVPVQQEVVDNDALVTATLLDRYMTFETILRRHKHDATNMAYPFAIELTNK